MTTITEHDQWLGVELRHLAALAAVAKEGSFSRAARRLGYTQSAISQQVATLERIVGEKLIDRPGGPRSVSVTDAGALLLRHAEAIVARLDAARADLHALRAGETGALRIGTFQSVGARLLPDVMRRFMDEWPGIELALAESASEDPELLGGVERGELDLAFGSLPIADGPFETARLLSDPWVLLVPSRHSLARRKSASLRDVGDTPMIRCGHGCAAIDVAERALHEQGHHPGWAFNSDDNGTVQGLVAAGFGIALTPLLAVSPGDDRVRALRLDPPIPRREIAVVWHRDRHRSPAARAFVDVATAVSAELQASLVEP